LNLEKRNIKEVAARLKALRKQRHLSAEKVAREINISTSALLKYEIAYRYPSAEAMAKLANFYGEDLNELFFVKTDY